jgi:hypothetical protein
MQQLHGFDELRNAQGITRNRRVENDKAVASLYLSASYLSFDFFHQPKKERMKNGKNRVFGRSVGGQDNLNKKLL